MRKSTYLALGFLVGLLLIWGVFQFFPIQQLLILLLGIPPNLIAAYLAVSLVIMCLLAYRWTVICRHQGTPIRWRKLLGYRFVGHAFSFITPGPRVGGEPARAALLKRDGIPFTQAFSGVVADKTIELVTFGVLFIISLGAALLTIPFPTTLRTVLAVVELLLILLVGYGLVQMLQGKDPILKIFKFLRLHNIPALKKYEEELREFEDHIHEFYSESTRAFWYAMLLSAAAWGLSLIEYKLILLMLGVNAGFVEVFLVFSMVGFVYMLPIPLALGSLEAGQAGLFAALGMKTAAGAALALITRGRDLVWMTIGFILLGYYGLDAARPNDEQ